MSDVESLKLSREIVELRRSERSEGEGWSAREDLREGREVPLCCCGHC